MPEPIASPPPDPHEGPKPRSAGRAAGSAHCACHGTDHRSGNRRGPLAAGRARETPSRRRPTIRHPPRRRRRGLGSCLRPPRVPPEEERHPKRQLVLGEERGVAHGSTLGGIVVLRRLDRPLAELGAETRARARRRDAPHGRNERTHSARARCRGPRGDGADHSRERCPRTNKLRAAVAGRGWPTLSAQREGGRTTQGGERERPAKTEHVAPPCVAAVPPPRMEQVGGIRSGKRLRVARADAGTSP